MSPISAAVASLLATAVPLQASPPLVTGDAVAGLVSTSPSAEVHLLSDPALNNKRLVLKLVVVNRSSQPQPLDPGSVTVKAGDDVIPLASRDELVGGAPDASDNRETAQGHANPSLPVTTSGQTDVSGFTGGMGAQVGGVPVDRVGRASKADPKLAAAIDAVLLKSIILAPGKADGGQLLTRQFKGKTPKTVEVDVRFAGEVHRFEVAVPR